MNTLLEYMEENGIVELYHDYLECAESVNFVTLDYHPFIKIVGDALIKWRTLLERAEIEVEDTNEIPHIECEIHSEDDIMVGLQITFDGEDISFQVIYSF